MDTSCEMAICGQ